MNSTKISETESRLMAEIENRDMIFFTPSDVYHFLDLEKKSVYDLLSKMVKKDLIRRVESGRYILTETLESRDVYELVSSILGPSYLGFLSALHFHGLTDQVPQKVQVATTKRKKGLEIQGRGIQFVKISKDAYYGYKDYGGVVASSPEKTVVDCLRLPSKAGDFMNILDIEFETLDTKKLLKNAIKLNSSSVASRLGYILDQKSIEFDESSLKELITHYSKLDPARAEENPVNEWKVYANRDL